MPDPRAVLQLTAGDSHTGAARIAMDLHRGLQARGLASRLVVGQAKSGDPAVREIWDRPLNRALSTLLRRNLRRALHRRLWPLLANDVALLPGRHLNRWPEFRQCDVLHAHTLHSGFFNLKALPGLAARRPLIWTLHDMWALTGYAVHAWDCPHWPGGGCSCRLETTLPELRWNNTRHLWRLKQRIYERSDLTVVAPSRWMADQVARSMLRDKPCRVIYNGVDTDLYSPGDRATARRELALPQGATVALFLGRKGSRERWKGWSYFRQLAATYGNRPDLLFVALGEEAAPTANLRQLPFVRPPEALVRWYRAADLLVYPSLADNCPLVVLEAQACGLPVLAFATGGIPELIADGATGWLVPPRDGEALRQRFEHFLAPGRDTRSAIPPQARRRAESRFPLSRMVDQYLKLYRNVLAARRQPPA